MHDQFSDPTTILPAGKIPSKLLGVLLGGEGHLDDRVVVGPGIGRDAAVIDFGDRYLVAKSDPITFATDESARYLVTVNANDLACVGAIPRWLMVTALLPDQHTSVGQVARLFDDLASACDVAGISLVGGHTEITSGVDRPILVGMLLGEATPSTLLRPGRASPGDRLLITAPIAIEGTALLARELRSEFVAAFGESFTDRCAALLIEPGISVSHHASAILAAGGVTALHDPTEGGLATGIREIAEASGCGAVVNRDLIPVLEETLRVSDHFGLDPLGLLASGSLLVAATPEHVAAIQDVSAANGFISPLIGKLTVPERGFSMVSGGMSTQLPSFEIDEVARLFSARRLPE